MHRGNRGARWEVAADGQAVWAQRPLVDDGVVVAVLAAKLDVGSITERRRQLRFATLAFGFAVAALGGALAALASRQALRPVLVVTDALDRAGAGGITPIAPEAMPPPGTEATQRAVRLDWRVQLPQPFMTNASLLRQAALNLLLNAVAATPRGGRVTLQVRPAAGSVLTVTIEDEGPGLPPDGHRRLIGDTDNGEARGLGLEVVATLARRLSAEVVMEAGLGGRGTRVTLAVPASEAVAAPDEAVPA